MKYIYFIFCFLFSLFQLHNVFSFSYRCTALPTPSYISKTINASPFSIAQAMQMLLPTQYLCAVVHVDKW